VQQRSFPRQTRSVTFRDGGKQSRQPFPNQPAIVAGRRPGPDYKALVERRWKVISQLNDPVALEVYRALAQKIGANLTDVPVGDAQKMPKEQAAANQLDKKTNADKKTLTNSDFYPAALAFHRRTLLDAYRDHGARDEKWKR
jgi:hypothetical protein